MTKKVYGALTCIFILGLLLRTIFLSQIPVSLTIDEVGIGYNAYSILKTAKDEFGKFLPAVFRSVGDYKSPLPIYFTIPGVAIFGLNDFGIRFPIALFGSLTVIVSFILAYQLTRNRGIALVTALLMAISPWHIKPSRMTQDGVPALFLVILGVVVFLYALRKRPKLLWLSMTLFVLSTYAYHTEKVFTPLLLLGLGIIYFKDLWRQKKQVLLALVVGFVVAIPMILVLVTPEGRTRGTMTFLTKDVEINKELHSEESQTIAEQLFDNNVVITLNFWAKRYIDYLDLRFLYAEGMGFAQPKAQDIGLLYLFELPLGLMAVFVVFFKKQVFDRQTRWLIILWLAIGPLAASLANNAQHHLRSMTLMPILQLFSAIGLVYLYGLLKKTWQQTLFLGATGVIILVGVIYFLDLYAVHAQKNFSEAIFYGWKQAAQYSLDNASQYEEVVIDPKFGVQGPYIVGIPYLYLLVYGQIDPHEFQTSSRRNTWDGVNFRNFTFRDIDWSGGDKDRPRTLYIGSPWVLPVPEDKILKKFYLYNGHEILRAVEAGD